MSPPQKRKHVKEEGDSVWRSPQKKVKTRQGPAGAAIKPQPAETKRPGKKNKRSSCPCKDKSTHVTGIKGTHEDCGPICVPTLLLRIPDLKYGERLYCVCKKPFHYWTLRKILPSDAYYQYIEAINASRKCCVCLYTLSTSAFPSGKLTAACNHPAAACTSCLTDLFTDCFAKNVASFEAPKCPECAETLSVTDVQRIGGRSLASAYNERLTLSLLRADPDFRECLNPDCSAGMGRGQLHEGGEEAPIVTCKYCSAKSCFAHKLPWHEGQTCEEFDEANAEYRAAREKENQLSTKYMEKKYKRCPKCKAFIEKFHGCNHMTCRACEHEFCWLCMAPYRGRLGIMDFGNRGHYVGCRFHG